MNKCSLTLLALLLSLGTFARTGGDSIPFYIYMDIAIFAVGLVYFLIKAIKKDKL